MQLTFADTNSKLTIRGSASSYPATDAMNGTKLVFDSDGWVIFKDHEGNEVRLDKGTWWHIVGVREREYLSYDSSVDLIADTIAKPDEIRQSTQNINSRLIYKKIDTIEIMRKVFVQPVELYMVVVVERRGKADFLQTAFTTRGIKRGKVLWHKENQA